MDAWLLLRNHEQNGERNRTVFVLKSRGMNHSNQVREFILSDSGIGLVDVYLGAGGVMTGSARIAQGELDRAAAKELEHEQQRRTRQFAVHRKAIAARIAALEAESEALDIDRETFESRESMRDQLEKQNADAMTLKRGGRKSSPNSSKPRK